LENILEKMNKKVIFFGLFFVSFVVISLGVVSSAGVCSEGQTILKLSGETNAHGAVWSDANYNYEVCYNDIFGKDYVGSGDVHASSGSNRILSLSSQTNAHAEFADGGAYTEDIYFGDLECLIVNPGDADPVDTNYKEVVRLSGLTNAHLAAAGTKDYDYRIFCRSAYAGGGTPSNPIWVDLDPVLPGKPIVNPSTGVQSCVDIDRVVRLLVEGGGLEKIEVFKKGLFGISINDELVKTYNADEIISKDGFQYVDWNIADSGVKKGDKYFFRITPGTYTESGVSLSWANSDIIEITQESCLKSDPVPVIRGIEHKSVYYVSSNNNPVLSLEHDSYDLDSGIGEVGWILTDSDGDILLIESGLEGMTPPTYPITESGQITITHWVEDNGGNRAEVQIAITAISSPGMVAFINKPKHQDIVISDSRSFEYFADDSFVVDSTFDETTCEGTATCVAGNCPTKVLGIPESCSDNPEIKVEGTQGSERYYLLIQGDLNQGFDNLNFKWEFDNGVPIEGIGRYTGRMYYSTYSSMGYDKNILLTLSYRYVGGELIEKSSRDFAFVGENFCAKTDSTADLRYLDVNGEKVEIRVHPREDNTPVGACNVNVVNPEGVGTCCPRGHECLPEGGGEYSCKKPGFNMNNCGDYNVANFGAGAEISCKGDSSSSGRGIFENDPAYDQNNCGKVNSDGDLVDCKCKWDSGDSICKLIVEPIEFDNQGEFCRPHKSACVYKTETKSDACEEFGQQTVTLTGKIIDLDEPEAGEVPFCNVESSKGITCVQESKDYAILCGSSQVKVPFFGIWNFVIASLLIGLLYLAMFASGKKK
jgi:hypothetical protein